MAKRLDSFRAFFTGSKPKASPKVMLGAPGTAIYGGYIVDNETNPNIRSKEERFRTYADIMANTSIVAAGMRYFLNLVAKASWSFTPSETDTDGKFAERVEQALMSDPSTPWPRVVRRAAMFRFYGFSIQEWQAKRSDDGWLTFADFAPRAQRTIEKWDTDVSGVVRGVVQRSPQTAQELYLPRDKIVYMVDDTLHDSPEGLGLLRHLVDPARRLDRYEQLEGYGYETDLRGVPIGRGPFTELAEKVQNGEISEAQRVQIEAPLRSFMENHVKSANLGMLLDSMTYESKDEAGRASASKQWDIELLKTNAQNTSFAELAAAIERLDREMARILGVEQLMLGSDGSGSFALSRDKTSSFYLMVDAVLTEIMHSIDKDIVDRLFILNGWPKEMKPSLSVEAIRFTDVEQMAKTLVDMAKAGAPLDPNDPVVTEVRNLMGVSAPTVIVAEAGETDPATSDEDTKAPVSTSDEGVKDDDDKPVTSEKAQ